MLEAFAKTNILITFLASNEDIGVIIKTVFESCGGVLIDRNNKASIKKGMSGFCENMLKGMSGVIFGEATWNLHPYKPMLPVKIGVAKIAEKTGAVIIPTIFEYIEVPEICSKETNIYSKCIVSFGRAFLIKHGDDLVKRMIEIQLIMENNRTNLWNELGIYKTDINDIDPDLYLNHTYLKKFGVSGVYYDSEREKKFIYSPQKKIVENEYYVDDKGNFVPGIIQKNPPPWGDSEN